MKWWQSAKSGQEDRNPNGWPVAKRMRRLEPSRRESREVWQEKTFVPRPQATHANAVSRLNLASIIRPCTARGNLSVADDKSKEKRELRPFKPVVTDRPSIGINLRTDIHQSCAGWIRPFLKLDREDPTPPPSGQTTRFKWLHQCV